MASRLLPQTLFSSLWPDREDPDRKWKYLCRFCGKPAVPPKQYYCSDHCRDMCQLSVNWLAARRAAYDKDGGKCVYCGIQLKLYIGDNRPGRHTAECHHKFPVAEIYKLTWDLMSEWGLDMRKEAGNSKIFATVYTLLYLDVNNLLTYCPEHHKMIHAADRRATNIYDYGAPYEVARTYWAKFWDMANREHYTKKLDEWF